MGGGEPARPSEVFVGREYSHLGWVGRLLAEVEDPRHTLTEQLAFFGRYGRALDKFFAHRAAWWHRVAALGLSQTSDDGLGATEVLRRIREETAWLVEEQARIWRGVIQPALRSAGVRRLRRRRWSNRINGWSRRYFKREILPLLTPIGLDPAHPFPRIPGGRINLLVTLEGPDGFGRRLGTAVLQVPPNLPSILRVPEEVSQSAGVGWVFVVSVLRAHLAQVFPGMQVREVHAFRLTRDLPLWHDPELRSELEQVAGRHLTPPPRGHAIRLEVDDKCPEQIRRLLREQAGLGPGDVYGVGGPLDPQRLLPLLELPELATHRPPPLRGRVVFPLPGEDVFASLRRGDQLVHHPYETAGPSPLLLRQAATDPLVRGIKMTIHRLGPGDGPVVEQLALAARAGKEVTVVADPAALGAPAERAGLLRTLEHAGAKVSFGIPAHRTHARLLLVVRRESDGLRRYAYVATGDPHTSRSYDDVTYVTCDPTIAGDVQSIFLQLTGLGRGRALRRLLLGPFHLADALEALIRQETLEAAAGRESRIIARMNALTDRAIVESLAEASSAGVEIDLIVRGVCTLRPGVPGRTDRVRVRSLMGRFLDHPRVFHFHAGGRRLTLLSSADWTERGLRTRIEVALPVTDEALRDRLVEECLELALSDTESTWLLDEADEWAPVEADVPQDYFDQLMRAPEPSP